jgi:hypothetical protein
MDVGDVVQLSNIHADSFFFGQSVLADEFLLYIALCFEKEGGADRPYWPPLYLPTHLPVLFKTQCCIYIKNHEPTHFDREDVYF